MSKSIAGLCGIGLAKVVAYGWPTETPGYYGHLGLYAREFFLDDAVEVGPPPAAIVENMRRRWAKEGISDCP